MHEVLHDAVDVLATFSDRHVKPLHMRWNDRNYSIKNVNLVHTAREGQKKIFYFSVSDIANFFKLRLDSETLEWHLVEVYTS